MIKKIPRVKDQTKASIKEWEKEGQTQVVVLGAQVSRANRAPSPKPGGEISAKADQPGQLDVATNTRYPTTPVHPAFPSRESDAPFPLPVYA